MSIAFRSSSSYNSGASTTTSVSVNAPAGAQDNDVLMVGIAFTGGSGVTITPPAGFSANTQANSGTTFGFRRFFRRYLSTDTVPYVFTLSGAQYASAAAAVYSGVLLDTTPTFVDSSTFVGTGSGVSTPNVTTICRNDNGYGLKFAVSYNTTGILTTTASGTGYTTRADDSTTGGGNFVSISLADGTTNNPILNITAPGSTLSGAATGNLTYAGYLRPIQSQILVPAVDWASAAAINGASSGSLTYSPSQTNEKAVFVIAIKNAGATVTSVTSTNATWTLLGTSQNPSNNTRTEIWGTTFPAAGTTVTANYTLSGAVDVLLVGMSFVRAKPITHVQTASADTGAPSSTMVTRSDNALVISFQSYSANVGTTAAGSNTLILNSNYSSATAAVGGLRQTVATKGTFAVSSATAPLLTPWAMVQFEVEQYDSMGNFLPFV